MAKEEKVSEEEVKAHIKLHEATSEYQGKKCEEAAKKYDREDA